MSIEKDLAEVRSDVEALRGDLAAFSQRIIGAHNETTQATRQLAMAIDQDRETKEGQRSENIRDFAGRLRASCAENAMIELIRAGHGFPEKRMGTRAIGESSAPVFDAEGLAKAAWEAGDAMLEQWEVREGDHRVG